MPCHSYEPPEKIPYDDFLKLEEQRIKTKEELDITTRLLCATLREIENNKLKGPVIIGKLLPEAFLQIEGLEAWWNEHKKWDELRLIREEAKRKELEKQNLIKEALGKLSDKEKEALGL